MAAIGFVKGYQSEKLNKRYFAMEVPGGKDYTSIMQRLQYLKILE
jgi:hypothetical protein